jgi:predicted negative regulator of RcsB-dependent stress response
MGLKDPASAMALLVNHQPAPGQVGSFEEAKGDIFHSLGDLGQAREAYQKALENLSDKFKNPILEFKLADLPISGSTTQEALIEPKTSEEVREDDAT